MFNFSKKKSQPQPLTQNVPQAPPAPNSNNGIKAPNQPQSFTKVEDEMASFEIPDFTEDDLNFDLGINEFTPNPEQNQQAQQISRPVPQPIPQPIPQSVPQPLFSQESAPAPIPSQEVSEPPLFEQPSVPQPQFSQERVQQQRRYAQPQDFPPPAPEMDLEEEIPEAPEDMGDAEEEIPKFDVAPVNINKSFRLEPSRDFRSDKEADKEANRNVKREISSLLQNQAEKEIREQRRGIFMPSPVYEKVVILAEDTVKQGNYGEGAKTKISSLMESKKQHAEELGKITRSMIDSLLNCDARLFEKVVQDDG